MAPAIGRIRTRSSFRALARPDGRASSGPLRASYVQESAETPGLACVGYAVGRRYGNAVARNRLRRRLRAALREVASGTALAPGAYLVSARPDAADLDYGALRMALFVATTESVRRAPGRPGAAARARADSKVGAPTSQPPNAGLRRSGPESNDRCQTMSSEQ